MSDMANYGIMNYVLENYDTAELAKKTASLTYRVRF